MDLNIVSFLDHYLYSVAGKPRAKTLGARKREGQKMPSRIFRRSGGVVAAITILTAPFASPAGAQLGSNSISMPGDVVVTAPSEPSTQEIEAQAKAITRISDVDRDPLARFSDPVCPGVIGLPTDIASLIIDRIRYDADRVGAPVDARAKCEPNILVAFVRDSGAEVRKLEKTSGFLFAGLDSTERNEIQNEAGPVRAWNATLLRTRYGEEQSSRIAQGPVTINGSLNLGPVPVIMAPSSDSRIFLASQLDITSSVVAIDLAAIDGLSVVQIADYAAMRALARTRSPQGSGTTATILRLFGPGTGRPQELTSFDVAYLQSHYASGANLPASAKISGIARGITKKLTTCRKKVVRKQ